MVRNHHGKKTENADQPAEVAIDNIYFVYCMKKLSFETLFVINIRKIFKLLMKLLKKVNLTSQKTQFS